MAARLDPFRRAVVLAAVVVAAASGQLFVGATPAVADTGVIHAFPPSGRPYGVDYASWAARWSQWAVGTPTPQNPLLNPDNCGIGQVGKVRFLPAPLAPGQQANCTVKAGRSLLASPAGGLATVATGDGTTPAELKAAALAQAAQISAASVSVDGRAVANIDRFLVMSRVFSLNLPEDNILGLPGPTSTPAVAAGYFVVLRPMRVGQHTVALAGAFTTGEQFDITFDVTVLPG